MSIRVISSQLLLFSSFFLFGHATDEHIEVSCNINVKKPTHCVSEKFLSISVDPAVLLAGVNLSESSLCLAKHLSPAFIRIAGPTTQFMKYVDVEESSHKILADDGGSVRISPSMWFGVNEWFKLAKLTPIFAINDDQTDKGVWNPKSTLPLFEISDQLNVSCYWQLGYDNSDKNETRYIQDLNILHYILGAYGEKNDTWKIVGSDISAIPENQIENIMMELNGVAETVIWEPNGIDVNKFPTKDVVYKILQRPSSKPRVKVWTTVPKSTEPVTFSSALVWAKQIGNLAKMGYDVVFRQPRIHELFAATPIYWCSLLHKKLMGCNVLETKSNLFQEDTNIFAHCTRKQNSFVRRGALTVMIVNDNQNKYKVKVKLGNTLPEKSMEVQSYILTSDSANSTGTYLNGKLLASEVFHEKQPFEPKIRRTKSATHILLALPPLSIGFFVLPGARASTCIDNEQETNLLLEEIEEDQQMPFSEEVALQLGPRGKFIKHNLLEEITNNLKNEMKFDERYYNSFVKQEPTVLDAEQQPPEKTEDKIDQKERKHFIDKLKFSDKHKKVFDIEKKRENLKKYLLEKAKSMKFETKPEKKQTKLELTSDEIENILKERAVERAAQKNIKFTDEELDALLKKASKNFNKSRSRRSALPKERRAINMPLLEKYSRMNENQHLDGHQNTAIKRTPNFSNKKNVRERRAVNLDLADLKAKIAERKRFWEDKREELIGNSITLKENIKDKIRGLKSNLRFRRDINMDLLNKNAKDPKIVKKSNKSKPKENIRATIRQSGETSLDVLDDFQRSEDTEGSRANGEIFAELADSEELEEQMFIDANNGPKFKKHKLFDKKPKVDPFGIEHPTIDIVEPTRRKHKNKSKGKADDRLQFLTSSEEFTDIEEDLPCIHEFFGPEYSKNKGAKAKGNIPEINEYYDQKIFKKRSVGTEMNEGIAREKRDTGITIIEIFDNELPASDILPSLILDDPVLDRPFLNEIFVYNREPYYDETLSKTSDETLNKTSDETVGMETTIEDKIVKDLNNETNSSSKISTDNHVDEITETTVQFNDSDLRPENGVTSKDLDSMHDQYIRERRSIQKDLKQEKFLDKTYSNKEKESKKDDTSMKNFNNLNDQMYMIRDKLQERKDELDKLVQKQLEDDKKKRKISKLNIEKRSRPNQEDWNFNIEFPKLYTEDTQKQKLNHDDMNKVRRSIFQTKNVFGDYQSMTSDLKPWKSSDVSSFKRDLYAANSNLIPPNDYYLFKNIISAPKDTRKRRSIDTDVDFNDNAIDTSINEIKKEDYEQKTYKYGKSEQDIQDEEFLKFKLPNNVELEIVDMDDIKTDKNRDILNYDDKNDRQQNEIVNNRLENSPTNKIENQSDNEHNEEDDARLDVMLADNLFRLKLPNEDELDFINNGGDTEIKLIHNSAINEDMEDVKEFIPEITPRSIKSVDTFVDEMKNFFNQIGKELKYFFNKFNNN
ncbi:uncharacterized protein LOC130448364 [Diorhabda sublineata]|uniref:uncharacterized protein LOC130448364 n=1 Tax=Diorhabda sublineata TaxID=1163346 RepID=UPI0024E0A593|nr:uncharacterized protein LOC130448364 [Diorhabda sublineata]